MAQIIITNLSNKTLAIDSEYPNLLEGIQSHYIDWMHACGGKGRCTTCKAIVVKGMDSLNDPTDAELGYRNKGMLKENERLMCQSQLNGNLVVSIPEENKFPHIKYSE